MKNSLKNPANNHWRTILSTSHPFDSRFIRVVETTYKLDGESPTDRPHTYFHVTRPNAKAIVAILLKTNDGRFILNKQYRTPIHNILIEPVAWLVGDKWDESLEDAVNRECEEEVGYKPKEIIRLAPTEIIASSGLSDERYHLFLWTWCKPIAKQNSGEASEHGMETILLTEEELLEEFRKPSLLFTDAKLAVLMWYYMLHTQSNPLAK